MNQLAVFPRLCYIGGAVGKGLDVYVGGRCARFIRLVISGGRPLSLERLVVYGRNDADELVDLVVTGRASQSSVLDGDEAQFGAGRGANGIVNGYDRFSTTAELNPWWQVDFGAVRCLETLHLSNFCSGNLADNADSLKIMASNDGVAWQVIYDRNAPEILDALATEALSAILAGLSLPVRSAVQTDLHQRLGTVYRYAGQTLAGEGAFPVGEASETLLDFATGFLPLSLEPSRCPWVFHDLKAVKAVRVVSPLGTAAAIPLEIETEAFAESGPYFSIAYASNELTLPAPTDLRCLTVTFSDSATAHLANSARVEVMTTDGGWFCLYDNAHIAKTCAEIAWVAFLMGNRSPRAIGLITKARVMQRGSYDQLQQAYLFARLSMHGRPEEDKREIERMANEATCNDFRGTQLQFGRHGLSTPLRLRNQVGYAAAMKSVYAWLEQRGKRCFLFYGTLLGAVREGSFIPHDDDIDSGYISTETTMAGLRSERNELIKAAVENGWLVNDDPCHQFLTFTIEVPMAGEVFGVELFPIWKEGGENYRAYMQMMEVRDIPADIIGERNSTTTINGESFPAPANPEAFLAMRYGADWRTPNSLFEI